MIACGQFVFEYPEGQKEIFEQWSTATLFELFEPVSSVLHFFLALTARNPEVQALFTSKPASKSLLTKIFQLFEAGKCCGTQLMQLIASLLNSDVIRHVVYRKRKVKPFVSRIGYAVAKKDWPVVEAMLKILATLTFYPDGIDELVGVADVPDLLEQLALHDEAAEMPLFHLLVRNLKAHMRIWSGLAGALQRNDRSLFKRLDAIADADPVA
jgi:hypothetical protein